MELTEQTKKDLEYKYETGSQFQLRVGEQLNKFIITNKNFKLYSEVSGNFKNIDYILCSDSILSNGVVKKVIFLIECKSVSSENKIWSALNCKEYVNPKINFLVCNKNPLDNVFDPSISKDNINLSIFDSNELILRDYLFWIQNTRSGIKSPLNSYQEFKTNINNIFLKTKLIRYNTNLSTKYIKEIISRDKETNNTDSKLCESDKRIFNAGEQLCDVLESISNQHIKAMCLGQELIEVCFIPIIVINKNIYYSKTSNYNDLNKDVQSIVYQHPLRSDQLLPKNVFGNIVSGENIFGTTINERHLDMFITFEDKLESIIINLYEELI